MIYRTWSPEYQRMFKHGAPRRGTSSMTERTVSRRHRQATRRTTSKSGMTKSTSHHRSA